MRGGQVAYRLVALDLDGTVMGADLRIPGAVLEAVAAAQAAGVRVTLATGRTFGSTLPFAERLGIREPLICYQGALVRHSVTGDIYEHRTMPAGEAAEAVELLLAAGIFVIAYIDERLCLAEERAEFALYQRLHPEAADIEVVPDLPALVRATPPTKLLFVAAPAVVERELARLGAHFAGRLALTRSHEFFGEATAPGIAKGVALAALAARLGIPREATVAIGDQENDLSMIAWAGLGLAMGNAAPVVRDAADAVVPPVTEAGVAWALAEYVLRKH
jgi:hypothetical protein